MPCPRLRIMGFAVLFTLVSPVMRALPGDAAAVLAHCGPATNDQTLKPSNGPRERIITYNNLALRFQPVDGDWSYFAASDSGVPLPQPSAVKALPCLGDALEEVAARPILSPATEAAAVAAEPVANKTEMTNKLFLFIVAGIVISILFFAVRPYMKTRPGKATARELPRSPTRKPSSDRIPVRPRKPADPPSSTSRRAVVLPQIEPPNARLEEEPTEEE